MCKIRTLFTVIILFLSSLTIFVYAQDESGRQGAPQEAAPAAPAPAMTEAPKETARVSEKLVGDQMPSYKANLKQILREAEENIKKIDEQLAAEKNEKLVREHFEKGKALHKEGNLEGARDEWNEAVKLGKDPLLKKRIQEDERRAVEKAKEEKRIKKEEEARAKAEARHQAKEGTLVKERAGEKVEKAAGKEEREEERAGEEDAEEAVQEVAGPQTQSMR